MRPEFLDPLDARAIEPDIWEMLSRFRFRIAINGKTQTITVPIGFQNDLASIPRGFTWLIPKNGRHRWAAVIHDWLYSQGGVLGKRMKFTQKEADKIFLEAMKVMKVPAWKRALMYRAVRIAGFTRFGKCSEHNKQFLVTL